MSGDPGERLVLGVDAGATGTRCVVATTDGEILGRGTAGGSNFRSSGADPAGSIQSALVAALDGLPRPAVATGVIGMAGAAEAGRERQRDAAERAWTAAGLSGEPVLVTDIEVAFAAGSIEPSGLLLLAGTGAVAAAIEDFSVTHRRDGYGWLLGDEGSAVWLAINGLRAALAGADGRGDRTALTAALAQAALGRSAYERPEDLSQAFIAIAYGQPMASVAALAPLVDEAALAGDAVARRICAEAASRLLTALEAAHAAAPRAGAEVVLAGSVVRGSGFVATRVATGVRDRFGVEPRYAADGAAGAAALAVRATSSELQPAVTAHKRLIAG